MPTWDDKQYLRFSDERTQPARDLAARVALASPQSVIDLGCGPGNSTKVLIDRWPKAEICGLDISPEMIAAAQKSDPSRQWIVGDITKWVSDPGPPFYDVIFSNAALQWVDEHEILLPILMTRLNPGGVLAIQMPGNFDGPAHRAMRDLATSPAWRDQFPPAGVREWQVHDLPFYYDVLSRLAEPIELWETEYFHVMPNAKAIVEWYRGTGLRPFLECLDSEEKRAQFTNEYLQEIRRVYPPRAYGRVLFPFRRLFLIAYRQPGI